MDENERFFADLSNKIVRKVADAIEQEAEDLSEAQRAALRSQLRAPEDTGDLEESCRVEDGRHPWEKIVAAGGSDTTDEVREGSGIDFDYGEAFEHGTTRQAARPFFYPTYNERREQIARNIQRAGDDAA